MIQRVRSNVYFGSLITCENFTLAFRVVTVNVELSYRERPGAVLYSGQWSQDGCETKLISNKTICSCNHLTHFAIILSAKPANLSDQHSLALGIIGKVGVAISLVAMTMTVVIFIILK